MTIGEKIRNRRIELDMSQEELAKKCGYKSRSSIQKIEASRDLPLKKVRAMASALDLSVSYLMGWDDIEYEKESHTWEVNEHYVDKQSAELAQFLLDNPEYKILFDASRKVKPGDIKKALKAIGIFIDE